MIMMETIDLQTNLPTNSLQRKNSTRPHQEDLSLQCGIKLQVMIPIKLLLMEQ